MDESAPQPVPGAATRDAPNASDASVPEALESLRAELRQLRDVQQHLAQDVVAGLTESQEKKAKRAVLHSEDLVLPGEGAVEHARQDQTRRRLRAALKATNAFQLNGSPSNPRSSRRRSSAVLALADGWAELAADKWTFAWEKDARCLISEAHAARQLWDLLSAILILLSLVLAPLDLGFRSFVSTNQGLFGLEVFTDVFFLADVVLNFFTTYIDHGNEVRSLKLIWRRYTCTWLGIDLLASIPFSFVTLAQRVGDAEGDGRSAASNLKALKVLKLIKIGCARAPTDGRPCVRSPRARTLSHAHAARAVSCDAHPRTSSATRE